jgi:hypothetical protein
MLEEQKKRLRELEESLPEIRQVRFKDVTFCFYIEDLKSLGLGEELVELVRDFKKVLEPHLKVFKLPRLVRIIIWEENPQALESSATFGGILPFLLKEFHISINTNNLHNAEQAYEEPGLFNITLMRIFLHELAHFVTTNEDEANEIARDILKKIMTEKPINIITERLRLNQAFEEEVKKLRT